jgi:hypothetical protein
MHVVVMMHYRREEGDPATGLITPIRTVLGKIG